MAAIVLSDGYMYVILPTWKTKFPESTTGKNVGCSSTVSKEGDRGSVGCIDLEVPAKRLSFKHSSYQL